MEAWLLAAIDKVGVFALAAFALFMLNKVWADRLTEQKRYTEEYRLLSCQLRDVITDNTKVITRFIDRTQPVERNAHERTRREDNENE